MNHKDAEFLYSSNAPGRYLQSCGTRLCAVGWAVQGPCAGLREGEEEIDLGWDLDEIKELEKWLGKKEETAQAEALTI